MITFSSLATPSSQGDPSRANAQRTASDISIMVPTALVSTDVADSIKKRLATLFD
jgi:hypothetical protein